MTPPDDELIGRAKHGDAEAWRALYRAHAGRLVVWLSVRPTNDAAVTAEDLAAEAWLTAAQKIVEFHGSADDFAGWLFGVARNLTRNTQRRSGRRRTDPLADHDTMPLPAVPGPEDAHVDEDFVRRALAALPPRERDVVGCTEVVGLSTEATAAALGISAVAVRVARHRGLRRLRSFADPTPTSTRQKLSTGSA